ncbi:MAG: TolC family protein, partial [Burkholderiales bacterium]|nr:TolC family protein [Burkholderiales bacterium]
RDRYVGVQLDIPLFEGLTRTYQIRQAQAQVEVQKANLVDAEQQVAQEVWRSYQQLQTDVENLRNSAILLDSAQQSFDAAQHRYDRGVGNILELLNAQTALANAKQQRVQALADWRIGKVQLMGSLGRLALGRLE